MARLSFKNNYIIIACVAALVLFLFFVTPVLNIFKELTIGLVSVPAKIFSEGSVYFSSKRALSEENALLEKRIADLNIRIEQMKGLNEENERLRELLELKKRLPFETISAEVVARNPNGWVDSIIINRGLEDDIQKDSAICSSEGLLGKVYEAGSNTSSVMLITHPAFKAGGSVKDTGTSGIIAGSGDGMVRMLYIPIDADIDVGQVVVTSEFSRIFPRDIGIGEIVSVGKSKTGLYKYAVIKPFVTPSGQEEVICFK